jgi:hypothetical protein
MNDQCYRTLIQQFCARAGIENPAHVIDGGRFSFCGAAFILLHEGQKMPDIAHARIDLGPVEQDIAATIWLAMLSINHERGLHGAFVFSVERGTGNAVLTLQFPLNADMSAAELARGLQFCAQQARECWDAVRVLLHGGAGSEPPGEMVRV